MLGSGLMALELGLRKPLLPLDPRQFKHGSRCRSRLKHLRKVLTAFPAVGGAVSHSAARASRTGRPGAQWPPQQSGTRGAGGARAAAHGLLEPPRGGGLAVGCGEAARAGTTVERPQPLRRRPAAGAGAGLRGAGGRGSGTLRVTSEPWLPGLTCYRGLASGRPTAWRVAKSTWVLVGSS